MTTQIILSPAEVNYAMALAIGRDASKNQKGCPMTRCKSKISKKHTSFGVNLAGLIGELASRKVYGGKINTEILPEGDGHAPDLITADGRGVEVKTSLYAGSQNEMIFMPYEVGCSEHYCLVKVTLPDIAYVYPIIDLAELESTMYDKDFGYGARKVYNYKSC